MFKREQCDLCGDCLVDCQWMDVERGQAVEWIEAMMSGERTPVLDRCITCYACNEICPQGANPFDLIAGLQEKYHSLSSEESIAAQEARFEFSQELKDYPTAERVMSICVFGKTDAHLIQGELYDLPRVGGRPYFCWLLFSHIGAESVQRKRAQALVDRLALTGAREVVCFHDDCYAMLARLVPDYGIEVPFRPVHLSEYLVEFLKANKSRVKPLHMNIAYQRPCASRHTPEKEGFIDELFELVGVNRVKRAFDREKALCCAGIKMALGMGDPRPDQEKNILDAKNAGAQALVCLCPMCILSLSGIAQEYEMPLIFLGDLVRMAIGEKEHLG
ncbi:MAG: (Fe-S)-binding protein [Deltaproteobacteria bacterium]|nr:(Fe-S)-binding protein [Deltaproteobacteria bacterium]